MTPLMEILQNRISTVACKTLRVSHISHRPHHQLINEPDSTLKKLVPCPKNGEHLSLRLFGSKRLGGSKNQLKMIFAAPMSAR